MMMAIEGIKYKVDVLKQDTLRIHGVEAIDQMQRIFKDNRDIPAQIVKIGSKPYIMSIMKILLVNYDESYIDMVVRKQ